MPKISIYVTDALADRVKDLDLQPSKICQEALWDAVAEEESKGAGAKCRTCKTKAAWMVTIEGSTGSSVEFSCDKHVHQLLGDVSTVRSL
jgi:hypothetical protein